MVTFVGEEGGQWLQRGVKGVCLVVVIDRNQDHPQEKEMQKSKMAVWGGLANSCEKKRSEKQRKKGRIYPSECRVPKNSKERQESLPQQSMQRNRGKQQNGKGLFKKIRDTKGTFHAKMGSIKDRNGRDLTEAEDVKKRWQEYTELYEKDSSRPR